MILPEGYKDMTDEQLLVKLTETYGNQKTAQYILDVVRSRVTPPQPLR